MLLVNGSGVVQNLAPAVNTFRSFSPRLTVDWKFLPHSLLYGLWSRGTRPGGFNTQTQGLTAANLAEIVANGGISPAFAYDEERLSNYEVGFKHRFWNNRANITVALYYQELRNGQNVNNGTFRDAGVVKGVQYTVNAGSVNLKGVEIEAQVAPVRGLTISGTFALNDSTIKNYICSECTFIEAPGVGRATPSVEGNRLFGAPKYTWTLNGAYEHALTDNLDWFVRADYRHRGSYFLDLSNLARTRRDDRIDLRAGVKSEAVTFELFVQNLTNEQTLYGQLSADVTQTVVRNSVTTNANEIRLALPEKRRVGARISYTF